MSLNQPYSLMGLQENNRSCGDCSECCISLAIKDLELNKPADVACKHLNPKGGCSVYSKRPKVCSGFICGWLKMPGLPESLRPDKCGLIVNIDSYFPPAFNLNAKGDVFGALTRIEVLNFIAYCIHERIQISFTVPTKIGHNGCRLDLSTALTKFHVDSEYILREKMIDAITYAINQETTLRDNIIFSSSIGNES